MASSEQAPPAPPAPPAPRSAGPAARGPVLSFLLDAVPPSRHIKWLRVGQAVLWFGFTVAAGLSPYGPPDGAVKHLAEAFVQWMPLFRKAVVNGVLDATLFTAAIAIFVTLAVLPSQAWTNLNVNNVAVNDPGLFAALLLIFACALSHLVTLALRRRTWRALRAHPAAEPARPAPEASEKPAPPNQPASSRSVAKDAPAPAAVVVAPSAATLVPDTPPTPAAAAAAGPAPPAAPAAPLAPPPLPKFEARAGGLAAPSSALTPPHWFFFRHTAARRLDGEMSVPWEGTQPFMVAEELEPSSPDEVALRRGDFVRLTAVWRDGWAEGSNDDTGEAGMLPLDCLMLGERPAHILAPSRRAESHGASVALASRRAWAGGEGVATVAVQGKGVGA